MDRLVYLFELDSVVKYEHKLQGVAFSKGVEALFSEIIVKGNSVALTMNQLADSQFMKEIIQNDKAYSTILQLFEYGALKVSLYNDIHTASQYMQQAIEKSLDKNDNFTFSSIPVKKEDKALLEKMGNALKFSDLSLISDEIEKTQDVKEKERLKTVYRFLNMILQISVCERSNVPLKETKKRSFEDFLKVVWDIIDTEDLSGYSFGDNIKKAKEILVERSNKIVEKRYNRSNWLPANSTTPEEILADKLVNICYNYTLEDSVNGVSKHYDDSDFDRTFFIDFVNRLEEEYREKEGLRAVKDSEFDTLVRFAQYKAKRRTKLCKGFVYEENFKKERNKWRRFIFGKNVIALLVSIMYIIVFLAVESGLSAVEDAFSIPVGNAFVGSIVTLIVFSIFGSLTGKVLSLINNGHEIPDVLNCFIDIWHHFCDFVLVAGGKYDSYKLP